MGNFVPSERGIDQTSEVSEVRELNVVSGGTRDGSPVSLGRLLNLNVHSLSICPSSRTCLWLGETWEKSGQERVQATGVGKVL